MQGEYECCPRNIDFMRCMLALSQALCNVTTMLERIFVKYDFYSKLIASSHRPINVVPGLPPAFLTFQTIPNRQLPQTNKIMQRQRSRHTIYINIVLYVDSLEY